MVAPFFVRARYEGFEYKVFEYKVFEYKVFEYKVFGVRGLRSACSSGSKDPGC
jgi:hypothetical protein